MVGANRNRVHRNGVHHNDVGLYIRGARNLMVGNQALGNNLDLADTGMDNLWRNNTYNTSNW